MIEGTFEIVLTVRIAVPPGQDPVEAGKQIANAGAMFPIGLVRFIKHFDVNVVPVEAKSRLNIVGSDQQ